jgi:ElaB/YqjD/DUF883 family membrane-anchored ribosome-binding protein
MKKILYILFFIFVFVSVSLDNIAFAESKLDKIKNKIKSVESKAVDKIWGTKDCSQYSTRTLAGLAKYKRCKSGLKQAKKKSWKKTKEFVPHKPCHEYSTKTFTGLVAKTKCKRAKKN